MKKYVIMVDYGVEGWKPFFETEDWDEAADKWKEALSLGNQRVEIMCPVRIKIKEY